MEQYIKISGEKLTREDLTLVGDTSRYKVWLESRRTIHLRQKDWDFIVILFEAVRGPEDILIVHPLVYGRELTAVFREQPAAEHFHATLDKRWFDPKKSW